MGFQNLGKRMAVAAVGAPLVLLAAWAGKLYFLALITAIALLAAHEFIGLAKKKGGSPPVLLNLSAISATYLAIYFRAIALIPVVVFCYLLVLFGREAMRAQNKALLNASASVLTYLYVGGLMAFMLLLRELPATLHLPYRAGGEWLVLIFVATWICDTAAYFVGSRFGRRRLAPQVSPNKTVEGAIGGVVAGVLTTWLAQQTFHISLTAPAALAVGLIVGVLGQASDLIESLFKRDAQVKDTSCLLPGHGGMLDRFDSEMLSVPAVYFYLLWFGP